MNLGVVEGVLCSLWQGKSSVFQQLVDPVGKRGYHLRTIGKNADGTTQGFHIPWVFRLMVLFARDWA